VRRAESRDTQKDKQETSFREHSDKRNGVKIRRINREIWMFEGSVRCQTFLRIACEESRAERREDNDE
jgi:hypothetical protein